MRVLAFQASRGKKSTAKTAKAPAKPPAGTAGGAAGGMSSTVDGPAAPSAAAESATAAPDPKGKKGRSKGDCLYYRVKCKDNGVGMPHDKVSYTTEQIRLKGGWVWSSVPSTLP